MGSHWSDGQGHRGDAATLAGNARCEVKRGQVGSDVIKLGQTGSGGVKRNR